MSHSDFFIRYYLITIMLFGFASLNLNKEIDMDEYKLRSYFCMAHLYVFILKFCFVVYLRATLAAQV